MSERPTEAELRLNHEFVMAFEALRKDNGFREMDDGALRVVAERTGIPFEELRICRHLRNGLAHGEQVNRETLGKYQRILVPERPAAATPLEPGDRRAYRVHAWRDEGLEREMLANGFVSVGDTELGDLTGVNDPEEIKAMLLEALPDRAGAVPIFVGYWRRFLWGAQAGDLIVLPTQSRGVAIGEFVGPYHYVADAHPKARHRRPVAWAATDVSRDAFDPDLARVLSGRHTIQDFNADRAVSRLCELAAAGVDPG